MEVKHSASVWIYLAYSFILLSYLNVNILFIRLFLILASVFFICFACIVGNVFVDSIVFNSVFIIINGVYSYFLLLKYLPIKLTPIEQRIFDKDFNKVMDKRTFRDFIRKGHLRSFSEGGQICHDGNNFSGLFYVALVNPNFKVSYVKKDQEYFTAEENVWIGVVEYMMYEKEKRMAAVNEPKHTKSASNEDTNTLIKKKNKVRVKWGLDAIVRERSSPRAVNDPIYEEEDDPCYVYEFPLGELEKLFNNPDEGMTWRNALYSIWLSYTTSAIQRVDSAVLQAENQRRKEEIIEHPRIEREDKPEYSKDFKRIEDLRYQEHEFNEIMNQKEREVNNEMRDLVDHHEIKININNKNSIN